jgi:hypothetical protein
MCKRRLRLLDYYRTIVRHTDVASAQRGVGRPSVCEDAAYDPMIGFTRARSSGRPGSLLGQSEDAQADQRQHENAKRRQCGISPPVAWNWVGLTPRFGIL